MLLWYAELSLPLNWNYHRLHYLLRYPYPIRLLFAISLASHPVGVLGIASVTFYLWKASLSSMVAASFGVGFA